MTVTRRGFLLGSAALAVVPWSVRPAQQWEWKSYSVGVEVKDKRLADLLERRIKKAERVMKEHIMNDLFTTPQLQKVMS